MAPSALILVVDDDPEVADLVAFSLRKCRFQRCVASSRPSARRLSGGPSTRRFCSAPSTRCWRGQPPAPRVRMAYRNLRRKRFGLDPDEWNLGQIGLCLTGLISRPDQSKARHGGTG